MDEPDLIPRPDGPAGLDLRAGQMFAHGLADAAAQVTLAWFRHRPAVELKDDATPDRTDRTMVTILAGTPPDPAATCWFRMAVSMQRSSDAMASGG